MFDSYIVNTYKSELTEIKKASDRYKEAEEKFYKAKSPTEIKKYDQDETLKDLYHTNP